jgi:hypothetical protein
MHDDYPRLHQLNCKLVTLVSFVGHVFSRYTNSCETTPPMLQFLRRCKLCLKYWMFSGFTVRSLLRHFKHMRASPPCCVKGTCIGKPFNAALEKNLPHPSPIPRPWLLGLFKLLAPLTILVGERCSWCAHTTGPHPLAIQWIVPLLGIHVIIGNIPDSFLGWRASMQVMVGECHPKKKFSACLELFKAHFESLPFCPRVEMLWILGNSSYVLENSRIIPL